MDPAVRKELDTLLSMVPPFRAGGRADALPMPCIYVSKAALLGFTRLLQPFVFFISAYISCTFGSDFG